VLCDLSFTPFKIFVSLPKPIASFRIEAPATATLGSQLPLKISALDGAGKIVNASIPLRIVLRDANGKEAQQFSCTAYPTFDGTVAAPLGFAAGNWTLHIEELISGRQTDTAIAVAAPQGLPFGTAIAQIPRVDI